VPLYAVETIRMLMDRGALVADGDQLRLTGHLPPLSVPETLHALIAARLDALPAEERSLVTDGAVLGISFTVASLQGISGMAVDEVSRHLDALVKREMLVLDVDPLSAERGQYRFIQGVVREVAYQSLAKKDRRAKHLAAARYFESLGEDELAGVLASHYLAAYRASPSGGEADALAAQARVALRAAADRATALHAPHGALEYLERALEVTEDPLEQAALHERASAAAGTAARIGIADSHARSAAELYAARGDRLGVLRSRIAQAWAKLGEHGDQAAIAILREALAEAADLPTGPEIVQAQSELARALMIQGSPEALVWSDRVLENPNATTHDVVVSTLITKGSILMYLRRMIEAEAVLRGATVLADRLGDPMSMLRARNNIAAIVESHRMPAVLDLSRELLEIAERYGERTWVQQAIGLGLMAGFRAGRWHEWQQEAEAELPDAAGFYGRWFRAEAALRLAYRGDGEEANRMMAEIMAEPSLQESAQAMAGMAGFEADILLTQGRWLEAFESSRRAWPNTDAVRSATEIGQLAAAAAGDASRLAEAIEAHATGVSDDLPLSRGSREVGVTLSALLSERWDEARAAYLRARRLLEETEAAQLLAQLNLAVGTIAAGRFSEATDAARDAEEYFRQRGADGYVATYRAKAFAPARSASDSAPRATGELAETERSAR